MPNFYWRRDIRLWQSGQFGQWVSDRGICCLRMSERYQFEHLLAYCETSFNKNLSEIEIVFRGNLLLTREAKDESNNNGLHFVSFWHVIFAEVLYKYETNICAVTALQAGNLVVGKLIDCSHSYFHNHLLQLRRTESSSILGSIWFAGSVNCSPAGGWLPGVGGHGSLLEWAHHNHDWKGGQFLGHHSNWYINLVWISLSS